VNETPKGGRLHIAIFGCRNAGKSSLINALTNQDIALVSEVAGTTTDPVYKAMEILPLGPVMIIDTAGIDDTGDLGLLRVQRTMQVLNKTDVAVLVLEAAQGVGEYELELIKELSERKIPVVGVINKADLGEAGKEDAEAWGKVLGVSLLTVSAKTGQGINELKQILIKTAPDNWEGLPVVGDLINPGDIVMLVVPIDLAAPKGRLILPQVQTLRDILDHDAYGVVVKERELKEALDNLKKLPKLVITDSQEFMKVAADTPEDVLLTSFSILMARYKGDLESLVAGAKAVDKLCAGDKVLIAEGCTHHALADDIGRVKIPRWLRQAVGGELDFTWVSGGDFPQDITTYKLIVHCGACMLNRKQMLHRIAVARQQQVPIVNYGVLIAYLNGILYRVLAPFPAAQMLLEED